MLAQELDDFFSYFGFFLGAARGAHWGLNPDTSSVSETDLDGTYDSPASASQNIGVMACAMVRGTIFKDVQLQPKFLQQVGQIHRKK